ncbi:haloalkane dehalogenase [Pseudonocardia yunnanensis]|uniref:Haloalkane dehalogenase n=1 Tax=Pseudonocardia yunnanensis TaxID=58107 RepID=A0ABW4F5S3_9PSEU
MTENWKQRKSYAEVLGRRIALIDEGDGAPIVFLHGNPTSSYLWRSVLPALQGKGRLIAPDLIGMGDSEKLGPEDPSRYTFAQHSAFLDALLEKLGVTKNVTLVLHDWGGALGFHWARRHPSAVRGIAYMEAIAATYKSWAEWPAVAREAFQAFRSEQGEELVLQNNAFVEGVLFGMGTLRELTEEEKAEYRRPYLQPGDDRQVTLSWPRQLPIVGEPADVVGIVEEFGRWLTTTRGVPKLFVNAEPGAILGEGIQRDFCRTWPDQTEITVPGVHYIQEDSGNEIGKAIADWLPPLA